MKYIPLLLLALSVSTNADDWVADWFDNATSGGAASFKNQKRGFYSMGNFTGRINTSVDNPISISLPKLSSGCGGVNLFAGGLSLLDEEYLVQKMENMMQAAPAIAFDMAIKTVTKEFSESLKGFENIANSLNSLQLDDCAIAKAAVTTVIDGRYSNVGEEVWSTITNDKALTDNIANSWTQAMENTSAANGAPTVDLSDQVAGCQSDFKDIFATSGSVIEKSMVKYGMSAYSDIVRGYIGDIVINISVEGKIPVGTEILPCDENADANMEDFVYGTAKGKNAAGICNNIIGEGLIEIIENNLAAIADAIATKSPLSTNLEHWINATPLPVYRIMYRASIDGTVDDTIIETSELLAFAYAERLIDDLYRNTRLLLLKTSKTARESGQGSNRSKICNKDLFVEVTPLLPVLQERLRNVRHDMRQGYIAKLNEYQKMSTFIDRNERIEKARLFKSSRETLSLGKGSNE